MGPASNGPEAPLLSIRRALVQKNRGVVVIGVTRTSEKMTIFMPQAYLPPEKGKITKRRDLPGGPLTAKENLKGRSKREIRKGLALLFGAEAPHSTGAPSETPAPSSSRAQHDRTHNPRDRTLAHLIAYKREVHCAASTLMCYVPLQRMCITSLLGIHGSCSC